MEAGFINLKTLPLNKYEHARALVWPTIQRFGDQKFKLKHIAEVNAEALEDVSRAWLYKAFADELSELAEKGMITIIAVGGPGRHGVYQRTATENQG